MAFSAVPSETKGQVNRAGEALLKPAPFSLDYERALELAEKWRACHAYPINTFQATLRVKLRRFSGPPIVAQRLKRMPTIIDKLKRYPQMKLSTMQDIGGLRAILGSVSDVQRLVEQFRKSRFEHSLVDEKDYIQNPRSEDGYRSVHLVYKYKNKVAPTYEGLRLELQIRTKLQHIWATAVETMGTFLGQALKSRQGDQEWLDFFALVSSAFAYKEKTPLVPRFSHLSSQETLMLIAKAEADLQALEKMSGFSVAVESISKGKGRNKTWFYHLIILDSLAHTVTVTPFDRESFPEAVNEYAKAESRAANGEKIEPVLVSAGPIDSLKKAYPNFFLDIQGFSDQVRSMIVSAGKA